MNKELSIEEKAQRYDKAIERAKNTIEVNQTIPDIVECVESLFPELKESGDERIRKELIDYFSASHATDTFRGIPWDRVVAWVEEQGRLMKALQISNSRIAELVEEKYNLEEKLKTVGKIAKEVCKDKVSAVAFLKSAGIMDENGELAEQYRQDEQEPVEEYNITGIGSKYAEGKLGEMIKKLKPINEVLEQKSADKTEPKFKVGDWVINTITKEVEQVIELTECEYICSGHLIVSFNNQHLLRRWTIQDAKDGNVLACNEEILLFKSYSVQGRISLYCWYNGQTNNFHSKEVVDTLLTTRNKVWPATKEQRDLLFQKMKEAGYKWDSEKKELKKVEQKSWSEEDEKYLKLAIENFQMLGNSFLTSWLKSLKDRVSSQPKQEWSEEDKTYSDHIITAIKSYYIDDKSKENPWREELLRWFKSFKERYNWKPSELQMEALESTTENCAYSEYQDCLRELIEQLKKLREG